MSSEVSSEQSCVCEGVGYDEVFLLGQENLGTSYDERDPSTNSFGKEDKDVDDSKGGSGGDSNSSKVMYVDPPI